MSLKNYVIDSEAVGFTHIEPHGIDDIGIAGIVMKIKKAVGDMPTYLSIEIDGKHSSLCTILVL